MVNFSSYEMKDLMKVIMMLRDESLLVLSMMVRVALWDVFLDE